MSSSAQLESEKLAIDGGAPVRVRDLPPSRHGAAEIGEAEIAAVTDVLRRQQIFRYLEEIEDPYAARLEAAYRDFTGANFAYALSGGTNALICALTGLGIGIGDEVIVPGYTYIATAAAVLSVGAIPVIAEIDDTLTLDPADFERKITPLTRCVIPVHMRGLPAQLDEISSIAQRHDLCVLEDVAQANGGSYRGRKLGSIGDAGAFSFQHYKVITSGEGGVLVTDDELVYRRAKLRADAAIDFWEELPDDTVTFAGANDRICELRAAVAYVQFGRLDGILARTRELKRRLLTELEGTSGIAIQRVSDPVGDCGLIFAFYLPSVEKARRFSRALAAEGVRNDTIHNKGVPNRHVYAYWDYVLNKWSADRTGYPWSAQYYAGSVEYSPDMCPQTLDYLQRSIAIGLSQTWTDDDVADVVTAVRKVARALSTQG